MIYLAFFLAITFLIYSLLLFREERKKRLQKRISVFFNMNMNKPDAEREVKEKQISFSTRICHLILIEVKRIFLKRIPGEKAAKLELTLLQAGSPFRMTPFEFRLLQIALIFLIPFLFIIYGVLVKASLGGLIFLGLLGFIASIFLPHLYIKQKIKWRNKQAIIELPDVLDLLTVSLEAGLGFDSALSKVVSKKEGILASEFHRCLEECRLGKTRREALTGVKDRLNVHEINIFISNILQAEKLGIGMVQVLRIQSNEVRERRKQRAEEEAMKAPIKMLFPLVLFIFPSLFIVLLGPAVIQFIETFNK